MNLSSVKRFAVAASFGIALTGSSIGRTISPVISCTDFVSCGFPNASNTGVPPGTQLTAVNAGPNGIDIKQDGTVIDSVDLTGSYNVYANNVTIKNSRITTSNYWGIQLADGYSGLKVLHCTIVGAVGMGPDSPTGKNGGEDYGIDNEGGPNVEVAFNDISEFAHNFAGGNGYVHDNYMHDLQAFINSHNDYAHLEDTYAGGGDVRGLLLEHNTLLDQVTGDRGETAAVYATDDFGALSNLTVNDNWLAGGHLRFMPAIGQATRQRSKSPITIFRRCTSPTAASTEL